MGWLQFQLETSAEMAPACEEQLLALGAAAVTLQDNADEPLFARDRPQETLWQNTRVSGLFPADTDTDRLWQSLPAQLRGACLHSAEILEDKDWEREWMQHYEPRKLGNGFWLCPSWLEPPEPDAVNLMLDPGLAFGTGTHPTTAMCLEALAGLQLKDKTIIDFGCGSGILAVAALLLGAETALATDTDPQALVATRLNAERNRLAAERLTVCLPERLSGNEQADLVVANILAGPLCELAEQLCGHVKPGGRLILSGILTEQTPMLCQHYSLSLEVIAEVDGWVALSGVAP